MDLETPQRYKGLRTETDMRYNMHLVIYTLPVCPNCEDLKVVLDSSGIKYEVRDLDDDNVRMQLLINSVTLIDAPIIEIDGKYYGKDTALKELKLWSE